MSLPRHSIPVKTADELLRMRAAGRIAAEVMTAVAAEVRPGVTTGALDDLAYDLIRAAGAEPTFKGYHGFPGSMCISVNEELIHGIPGRRVINAGDIVSLDLGVTYAGMIGDLTRTVCVGVVPGDVAALVATAQAACDAACAVLRAGVRVGDLAHAIQTLCEARGYGVVRDFVGHGVGAQLHEPPQIPNYGAPGTGPVIPAGATLAIEPMITLGDHRIKVLADKWTVVTRDGLPSAHYENTVLVTATGCENLTPCELTPAR
jgi:methionyl aminopeptidase